MSERPRPPGTLHVVWLVAALHARRLWNTRIVASRGAQASAAGPRGATGGKRSRLGAVLALVAVIFGMQSFRSAASIVSLASPPVEWAPGIVGPKGGRCLEEVSPWRRPSEALDPKRERGLRECLERDLAHFHLPAGTTVEEEVARAMSLFASSGREAFRNAPYPDDAALFPSASLRPPPEAEGALRDVLAVAALACAAMLVFLGIGVDREDLAKADGLVESLYQAPVSAWALHFALVVRRATVSFVLWAFAFPLWLGVGICVGQGFGAIGTAIAATLFLGLLAAAVQVLIETVVRMTLRPAAVRRIQAAASLLGSLSLTGVVIVGARPSLCAPLLSFAPFVRDAPPAAAAWMYVTGGAFRASALMVAWGGAILAGALFVVDRVVARGLLASSGNLSGARGGGARAAFSAGVLRGVTGKDLQLLLRDPNLLVQALFTPLLILGMQAVMGHGILGAAGSSLAAGAAAAFFVAAYGFAFGAANVLAFEGPCLWILFTLPHAVARLLRDKVKLWATVGLALAGAVLAFTARHAHPTAIDAARVATVLAGVVIYAFVAAGIGIFATDPLATTPTRRQRPGTMMLYLALVGGFARTVYDESAWGKVVALVLSAVLALALWQKVHDRLPYLLDPTEAPPPSIAVSDGVVAVVAYFFLQSIFLVIGVALDVGLGAALTIASAVAGAMVAVGALLSFRAAKVPALTVRVGLRRDPAAPRVRVPWPVTGVALGLAAAAVAILYLAVGQRFDAFREAARALRDEATGAHVSRAWLGVFAIGVAPIVEEVIFRGLIFRALRRSWAAIPAALASAALFAICHPPLATAPVFVLGFAAAIALETTGLLWASMVAHAVYNAAVFFAQ